MQPAHGLCPMVCLCAAQRAASFKAFFANATCRRASGMASARSNVGQRVLGRSGIGCDLCGLSHRGQRAFVPVLTTDETRLIQDETFWTSGQPVPRRTRVAVGPRSAGISVGGSYGLNSGCEFSQSHHRGFRLAGLPTYGPHAVLPMRHPARGHRTASSFRALCVSRSVGYCSSLAGAARRMGGDPCRDVAWRNVCW